MKLYFAPGACSLAAHIVLHELGLPFESVRVDMKTKMADGKPFNEVNPKGYVPALVMENGEVLSEGVAILTYLASRMPEKALMPKAGTPEYFRCLEWLVFISTELHKGMSPLFAADRMFPHAEMAQQFKDIVKARVAGRFDVVAQHLSENGYLMGRSFTVADAYLYVMLGWTQFLGVDISRHSSLLAYGERLKARPSVVAARNAEGLAG